MTELARSRRETASPITSATSASEETRDRAREVTQGHGIADHVGDECQRGDT
ncbi:hypothetical protein [Geodermatophilus poikilotrophus]|uniref:hypothetical protein n=1 Tax=Geodermatophilus poikilotrophus TaxID=1333667 RepID=UPI0015873063|nr:hypothetical protein [Geodermatophilus poikilotrophus]